VGQGKVVRFASGCTGIGCDLLKERYGFLAVFSGIEVDEAVGVGGAV